MRLIGGTISVGWTAVKVAVGAALVALGIVIVAGCVFAFQMADYLQDDVIPNADFELEAVTLDQSSFIYYLDSEGDIQMMQQIYPNVDRVWTSATRAWTGSQQPRPVSTCSWAADPPSAAPPSPSS